jgi:hypothetical protein
MDLIKPKFLIIPNKHVVEYSEMIKKCITRIGLNAKIDTRFEIKLVERLKNTETYIVIAVGKRNQTNNTLQIRLENQIQEMTIENFIKFTLMFIQNDKLT